MPLRIQPSTNACPVNSSTVSVQTIEMGRSYHMPKYLPSALERFLVFFDVPRHCSLYDDGDTVEEEEAELARARDGRYELQWAPLEDT